MGEGSRYGRETQTGSRPAAGGWDQTVRGCEQQRREEEADKRRQPGGRRLGEVRVPGMVSEIKAVPANAGLEGHFWCFESTCCIVRSIA